MANSDRTRKLIIRSAVVTSTTIATLVGAQNFAILDARSLEPALDATNTIVTVDPNSATIGDPNSATIGDPNAITRSAPTLDIIAVAPSITVLRQSGTLQNNAVATTHTSQPVASIANNIQPPMPAQISAPQPVIVQQANVVQQVAVPRTRSTR